MSGAPSSGALRYTPPCYEAEREAGSLAFTLDLLGGFRICVNGRVVELSSRKAKALLCRLAIEHTLSCTRDQLAALLWPDSDPGAGRQSLRQVLSELRRAVDRAPFLVSTNTSLRLVPDAIAIDVAAFRTLCQGDLKSLAQALALYRGELLEGMQLGEAAFDDWLSATRLVLHQRAINVCDRVIDSCEDDATALPYYEKLVQLDPTLERAHRAIMETHIANGSETAAIRQYSQLKHTLNRELGLDPDGTTTALYEDLLKVRRRRVSHQCQEVALKRGDELRPVALLAVNARAQICDDPEAAARDETIARARVESVARRFGGQLVASTDLPVAAFGLDTVHGTEVDRARLAAQSLLERSPTWRCAVSAGQVFFQREARRVSGQPLANAIALVQRVPPGETWLESSARAGLRMDAAVCPVADDEAAWRVVVAPAEPQQLGPIVAREIESRHFLALKDAVADFRQSTVLLIRGEAGIGKSRLLTECITLAGADGFWCCRAECTDYSASLGRDVVGQLLRRLLGLGDEASVARPVLAASLHSDLVALGLELAGQALEPSELDSLAQLTEQTRAERAAELLRVLVDQRSQDRPALIAIEDLHWASRTTLRVLSQLLATPGSQPVLLLVTSREGGEPLDHGWRSELGAVALTTLDLRPLKRADAVRIVERTACLDASTVQRIVDRAGGNPLFLEQLAAQGDAGTDIPANVQNVIVSRVDQLGDADRRLLSAASVLGRQGTVDALGALLGRCEIDLSELTRRGLFQSDGQTWRFHHALIRDCCYQQTLATERRAMHAGAADHYRDRDAAKHAEHLYFAGDPQAGMALCAAAHTLRARLRLDDATRLLAYVIEHFPEQRFAALLEMVEIELQLGKGDEAHAHCDRALLLASSDLERAQCLLGRGRSKALTDALIQAIEDLRQAVSLAAGSNKVIADASLHLGNALFPLGRHDECLDAHRASLAAAHAGADTLRIARAEGGLGDAHYQQCAFTKARLHFTRCVEMAEAGDHKSVIPANLAMLAVVSLFVVDATTALAHANRAMALALRSPDRRHLLFAHNVMCTLEVYHGDTERGLHHGQEALALSEQLRSRRFQIDTMAQRVHLLWCRRELVAARAELSAAFELLGDRTLLPFGGPYLFGLHALLVTSAEERCKAIEDGEAALALGAVSHSYLFFYLTALEAALNAGDRAQAGRLLRAFERYTGADRFPWADYFISRGRYLAGFEGTTDGPALRAQAGRLALHSPVAAV